MTAIRQNRALVVIVVWLATKIVVLGAVALTHLSTLESKGWEGYVALWNQWDTKWFESIVTFGYVGPYVDALNDYHYNVAFFPAYPATMALGPWIGLSPIAMGLVVSAVASLAASFAVAQLTRDVGGEGIWGVTAFLVAPTALFLTAAYTEALFCAFAFWAWVLARRQSWMWAGILAGAAALVRSNGLFLAAGLVVMFVLTRPWRAQRPVPAWMRGGWLLLPLITTLLYMAYLKAITGDWLAWTSAQRDFWKRSLVNPWESLRNTYELIWTFSPNGEPSSRMITEIIAMALVVLLVVVLLVKRWWPEAVYVAVTAGALGTSTMYYSVPRSLVVLFPLWMLLGVWLTRHRWMRWGYIGVCLPVLILVSVRFTQAQWIS